MGRTPSRAPPRTPGQRAGLDRSQIVAAARHVLDTSGVEAISMRAVAQQLGVAPNALYAHVADKETLVDALLDQVIGDIASPDPDLEARQGLLDLMTATRALVLRYPDMAPLFLSRPGLGPNAIRLGEAGLASLAKMGVDGGHAATALRILLTYTLGFAAQEAVRLRDAAPDARRARAADAFRGGGQPRMQELADDLSQAPGSKTFLLGLAWILDGVEATATRG